MALDFPNTPTNGTNYTGGMGSWTWDGIKWNATASSLYLPLAGGTMTGPIVLAADPTTAMQAATKEYVDTHTSPGGATISPSPPVSPTQGALWWDDVSGQLFVSYNDGNSTQWVIANSESGTASYQAGPGLHINNATSPPTIDVVTPYLPLTGGTLTGPLILAADPTVALGAVTKQYSDTKVAKVGDTMTGGLTINLNSGTPTGINTSTLTIIGANGSNAGVAVAVYGTAVLPQYLTTRARGTAIAPAAVQANDILLNMGFTGYGATAYGNAGSINLSANENWTDTAHGSSFSFNTIPNGGTSTVGSLILTGNGAGFFGGSANVAGGIGIGGVGSGAQIMLQPTGTGTHQWNLYAAPAGTYAGQFWIYDQTANSIRLSIDASGNAAFSGVVSVPSDLALTNTNTTAYIVRPNVTGQKTIAFAVQGTGQQLDLVQSNALCTWTAGALKIGTLNLGPNNNNWAGINSAFNTLAGSGCMGIGWNYTSGGGETDFFINRNGGGGGGLSIYDFPNTSGPMNLLMNISGAGNAFHLGNVSSGLSLPSTAVAGTFGNAGTFAMLCGGAAADVNCNAYYDGSNWRYITTGGCSQILTNQTGTVTFAAAPSGSAGAVVSFRNTGTIDINGNATFFGQITSYTAPNVDANLIANANQTSGGHYWIFSSKAAAPLGCLIFYDATANATRISIDGNGNCASSSAWGSVSDINLKTDIEDNPHGLAEILKVRPRRFRYTADNMPERGQGFIAQELNEIMPELIGEMSIDDSGTMVKTVTETGLLGPLVNAIKELAAQNAKLEARLMQLEAR